MAQQEFQSQTMATSAVPTLPGTSASLQIRAEPDHVSRALGSAQGLAHLVDGRPILGSVAEHRVDQFAQLTGRLHWPTPAVRYGFSLHGARSVVRILDRRPAPDGLIPLTCNEIQRLFTTLVQSLHGAAHRLRWSAWRRRHQARAQAKHYRRQAANQT